MAHFLLLLDGNGTTSIRHSKTFYVLSKLWNSAKVGSVFHKVTSTDPAFKSAGGFFDDGDAFVYNGSSVVLLINNTTSAKNYNVNGLIGNSASIYQTSSTQDMALVNSPSIVSGTISGCNLPAQSITVIVTSNLSTSITDMDRTTNQEIEVYPNPPNQETVINYLLQENNDVKIILYDVLGKQIETIVNEKQFAGTHDIHLNTDGLQNGIYFIKIYEGDKQRVKSFFKVNVYLDQLLKLFHPE